MVESARLAGEGSGLRECPGCNHKVSMSTSACIDTITVGEQSLMMRG